VREPALPVFLLDLDSASSVVTLHLPEEHELSGRRLEEALAWCLV
jgi:hypothetical protein